MTWTSPKAPTITFAGFRSRWMTPVGVGVPDRLAHLLEHRQEPPAVGRRVGPLLEQLVERPPLDELHRQERPAVGQGADLVDRRDAGVLELAGDPRLVEEPAGGERVGGVAVLRAA